MVNFYIYTPAPVASWVKVRLAEVAVQVQIELKVEFFFCHKWNKLHLDFLYHSSAGKDIEKAIKPQAV